MSILRQFLLIPTFLCLPLAQAVGQSGPEAMQAGAQAQQTDTSNCQDSYSASCSSANGPGENTTTSFEGGLQQHVSGSNRPDATISNPYGTGNQPLNQPSYRDEGALPDQARPRLSSSQYVAPEPLTEFQKYVAETTGQVLPIFGAQLFRQVPTTFSPVDQIPVPANAVVGPGDLLCIRIWGQVNFSADVRVDRSGEVYLPQVGPVHVAGLQYAELDKQLRIAIGRVYRNFDVSAQVGQIRSIQIYVVGRARRPGTYTVSSLSTLVDALFASGGPSLEGSLRHIQLKRASKLVVDFDLYNLLVNGNKSGDAPLEPGDVIYIPPVGPQIALLGSVKAPAIYEARLPQTLGQMLEQAAGATNVAGVTQLTIEHMLSGGGQSAEQIALTAEGLKTPVRDGDILRMTPRVPSFEKTITLRGNVANSGRYGWHADMHLSELFPERAALLTRNYWWQRIRMGLPAPEFEREPSLERYRQPAQPETLPISPEDQARRGRERQQQFLGQARRAGQTPGQEQGAYGQNVSGRDLAAAEAGALADNPDKQIYPDKFFRQDGQDSPETAALVRRDVITENTANAQGITDVRLPAPEIDWDYAVIERLDPETLKTLLIPFDLGRLVRDHDTSQDQVLQPGDVVTVFSQADIHVPIERQTRLVRLEGEFAHAGVYSVRPDETLPQLFERAGGLVPGAYRFGSEFTRVSVRAVQQRRLDEYVQKLQLQIERGVLSTSSSAASSAADLASASAASTEARELVAKLKQVRATGRIVLSLRAFSQGSESLPPLKLEDGDTFYVPPVPSSISVIGSVYDQNSFLYVKGSHVRDYLHLAGGTNRDADKQHPFVIRADGSVISLEQVGEKKFGQLIIQPGDTIVVSEKTFGPTKLRTILNFSQLFSQLAIGSAVLGTVL